MARAWLVDSRGFAGKVKNATQLSAHQIKDCGASRECPNCHYRIDNSDVSIEWPGLPAGVKFDPSDVEILEHLGGKVGHGDARPHLYIDEFIPTLEGDEGICYTHPENLPGVKKDGNSVHFFHRTSKAYATGHRKRRKIHGQSSSREDHVRWHKTGKTKAVIENGIQKGCKKIMVLYKSSKKGSKPDKSNWVMHQYHLGTKDDETDGEFVVSKIFYQQQPKLTDKRGSDPSIEESVAVINRAGPTTPNTFTPNPPWRGKRSLMDEDEECPYNSKRACLNQIDEEYLYNSPVQVENHTLEAIQYPPAVIHSEDEQADPAWLAGESQAEDLDNDMDTFLFCNEILDSDDPTDNFRPRNGTYFLGSNSNKSENAASEVKDDYNTDCGISDLGKLSETPPDFKDFNLSNLQYDSQELFDYFLNSQGKGGPFSF